MNHRLVGLLFTVLVAPALLGTALVAQEIKPAPVGPAGGAAPVQPGVPQVSGGNSWFPETHKDLGTFFGQGEGVGSFKFKNPSNKVVNWRSFTTSCQCTHAFVRVGDRLYEITGKPNPGQVLRITKTPGQPDQSERVQQIAIEAGAEGEVEVHIDMNGVTTAKQASLDIHTDDQAMSHMRLSFHAMGAQLFTVTPAEVNLNKMAFSETREFEVVVSAPRHPGFKITSMDKAPAFDVTWERAGDGNSWLIKGKYGPVASDAVGGGQLKFYTDADLAGAPATFTVRVLAMVTGPLEVTPGGFLTLGLVRLGQGAKREVTFEATDGRKIEATSLKFEKTTLSTDFLSATSRHDGNKLIVELTIANNVPKGLVKGELVIELDHPQVREKRIMFNGFVR